jgi:AraC-like DNA-binding protein
MLEQVLKANRQTEPIGRVSLLKLMLLLGDEYNIYWRGGNRLDLREEVLIALDSIEKTVLEGAPLRLKTLETVTKMSRDHLGRLFRKATGVTLVDYAQRRRIHHAALQLLSTDKTGKDISEGLGFTDSAHFTKSFQNYFGVSPNVYRQKFGRQAG